MAPHSRVIKWTAFSQNTHVTTLSFEKKMGEKTLKNNVLQTFVRTRNKRTELPVGKKPVQICYSAQLGRRACLSTQVNFIFNGLLQTVYLAKYPLRL